jgi:hypothetical protein
LKTLKQKLKLLFINLARQLTQQRIATIISLSHAPYEESQIGLATIAVRGRAHSDYFKLQKGVHIFHYLPSSVTKQAPAIKGRMENPSDG